MFAVSLLRFHFITKRGYEKGDFKLKQPRRVILFYWFFVRMFLPYISCYRTALYRTIVSCFSSFLYLFVICSLFPYFYYFLFYSHLPSALQICSHCICSFRRTCKPTSSYRFLIALGPFLPSLHLYQFPHAAFSSVLKIFLRNARAHILNCTS